jgi:signal transduction histidine kinase/DNA-binding response OmpR family regulator
MNGLGKFTGGSFNAYTTGEGLAHNYVECIHEDSKGVLYIGTRGGLGRFENDAFFNYTARDGLLTSRVNYILEDDRRHLWLAGPEGISRVEKKELDLLAAGTIAKLHPLTFNEQDGMKTRWCENNGMKSRDGKLWFASGKGAMVINPSNIAQNTLPPPVVIDALLVDGKKVSLKQEQLAIPPGVKRLEIQYTAPSFIKPDKIKFKIKLQGYDSDWVDMGNVRHTNYTDLSPGKYTFKVIARGSGGAWNEQGASLDFYKKPHWYETGWAYLGYILSFLLAVTFFVKWRSWKLVREKNRLEGVVKERTTEIDKKNKQLEEQSDKLKEMDNIKSRFFANISHEFRTPLTLIMGPLEQMLSGDRRQNREEIIKMALRNSRRLLTLINQLLDLSRLDSGKMQLLASRQNIVPFLKGVTGSFQSLLEQRRLDLSFQSDREDITLYYDTEKLEKVVVNLVANAVKFTPAGGKINVTAAASPHPPGHLEITVGDTGVGIPAEQLPYIFDRFYQADGIFSQEQKAKGTGIGLALVKELVRLHHGEISVDSSEGKGSLFTIRLPLGSDHLTENEITAEPGLAAAGSEFNGLLDEDEPGQEPGNDVQGCGDSENEDGGKDVILLVEDNPDVRRYIRGSLKADYTIIEAADGQEGIEKAREIIPDIIISDVMMPRKNGYQLCDTLKKDVKTSHVPIILLTAKASEDSIIEGLKTRADDYITKPFNTRILSTRIGNLIELRRRLQENIQREMILQPTEIEVSSIDRQFINELKETIEKNLADMDFGVDELAKSLYMSRTTLNRKVKALTGESTNRFIQSYRLKRGAQLLKENFGNVTEVAFAVGFSSSNYFTRCFKEKFQQLPHNYASG